MRPRVKKIFYARDVLFSPFSQPPPAFLPHDRSAFFALRPRRPLHRPHVRTRLRSGAPRSHDARALGDSHRKQRRDGATNRRHLQAPRRQGDAIERNGRRIRQSLLQMRGTARTFLVASHPRRNGKTRRSALHQRGRDGGTSTTRFRAKTSSGIRRGIAPGSFLPEPGTVEQACECGIRVACGPRPGGVRRTHAHGARNRVRPHRRGGRRSVRVGPAHERKASAGIGVSRRKERLSRERSHRAHGGASRSGKSNGVQRPRRHSPAVTIRRGETNEFSRQHRSDSRRSFARNASENTSFANRLG